MKTLAFMVFGFLVCFGILCWELATGAGDWRLGLVGLFGTACGLGMAWMNHLTNGSGGGDDG